MFPEYRGYYERVSCSSIVLKTIVMSTLISIYEYKIKRYIKVTFELK